MMHFRHLIYIATNEGLGRVGNLGADPSTLGWHSHTDLGITKPRLRCSESLISRISDAAFMPTVGSVFRG